MAVFFHFEDYKKFSFKQYKKTKWIKDCIYKYKNRVGEINFIFCSDNYILDINKKYLNHNYFTDIITFDNCVNNLISGDVFISIDTVKKNSKEYKNAFFEELNRVIIHGILHLVGFNDYTEKEQIEMTKQENKCLAYFYNN